jgi:hypothetical protein
LESFMTAAPGILSGARADQLRGDIDAGRTGEKVFRPDFKAANAPSGWDAAC